MYGSREWGSQGGLGAVDWRPKAVLEGGAHVGGGVGVNIETGSVVGVAGRASELLVQTFLVTTVTCHNITALRPLTLVI